MGQLAVSCSCWSSSQELPPADMCVIATELSKEEISEMVEYYSSKEFTTAKQEFDAVKAAFQEVSQAR